MEQDVMLRIGALQNSLTNAETKVAEYITAHPRDVLDCSISELAERCGVGDTSVFRFCKTLDYKGFTEFKMAVALSLSASEVTGFVLDEEVLLDDDIPTVATKLLSTHTTVLADTMEMLDSQAIDDAVKRLLGAGRVLLVGAGTSLLAAMSAYTRFIRIMPTARCVVDTHAQAIESSLCGPGDVVIAVSYSGLTLDTVECVRLAKENGASVIAITRYLKTPLTQHADIVLLGGSIEGKLQAASSTAMISALYLLDILYVEYFKRTYDTSLKNMDKTTTAVMDKLM